MAKPVTRFRGPKTGGDEADAGLAGHPAQALSDERRILLMAADDGLDPRVEEGVEYSVDLGARHPEYTGDTLRFQIANQYLRTAWLSHCASPDVTILQAVQIFSDRRSAYAVYSVPIESCSF